MATVSEHNGQLTILTDWEPEWTRPVDLRVHYPIGVPSRDYAHLLGQSCRRTASGGYITANDVVLRLESEGRTCPIANEERPIARPRGKGPWVWDRGRWEKRLYETITNPPLGTLDMWQYQDSDGLSHDD